MTMGHSYVIGHGHYNRLVLVVAEFICNNCLAVFLNLVNVQDILLDLSKVPRYDVRPGSGCDPLLTALVDIEASGRKRHFAANTLQVFGLQLQATRHGFVLSHAFLKSEPN